MDSRRRHLMQNLRTPDKSLWEIVIKEVIASYRQSPHSSQGSGERFGLGNDPATRWISLSSRRRRRSRLDLAFTRRRSLNCKSTAYSPMAPRFHPRRALCPNNLSPREETPVCLRQNRKKLMESIGHERCTTLPLFTLGDQNHRQCSKVWAWTRNLNSVWETIEVCSSCSSVVVGATRN